MRTRLNESTLNLLAGGIARSVTIRTMIDGTSHDTTSPSTPAIAADIRAVAMGCLLGLNYSEEARSAASAERAILDTSEFILRQTVPMANTYDTIYIPLRAVIDAWRIATEGTRTVWSDLNSRVMWNRFPEWRSFLDGITAYEGNDYLVPYKSVSDAESTITEWRKWGMTDGMPAEDPGMLFLMWNLYISGLAK